MKMNMRTALFAFLFAVAPAAPSRAARAPSPGKTFSAASFECPIPAAWASRGKGEEAVLTGPAGGGPIAARIWIRRVPPDHPLYPTAAAYVERHARTPDVQSPGWTVGKPEKIRVAGREAERLVNDTSEFVPPSSTDAKEVPLREEHVAVPAAKGFYVLVYSAPRPLFEKNRAAFAQVLAGFKPKP